MQLKYVNSDVFIIPEDGKSICRKDEEGPNDIFAVLLESGDSIDNWKDCEFGLKNEQ